MRYVYKFGGTSLENAEKIKKVALFIKQRWKKFELAVVVSAMGKTTNKLEALASSLGESKCETAKASLLSVGENISAAMLSLALENIGVPTKILTAKELKIITMGNKLSAVITSADVGVLKKYLGEKVVIVTGFQGIDEKGDLTLLGRGGSDTTAVMLASLLDCKAYIFTDVDGYHICDPNRHPSRKLKHINIYSAIEGAYASAKILDKRCLEIANKYKTDVEVLKSLSKSGTEVSFAPFEGYFVDGISFKTELSFVCYAYKKTNYLQIKFKNCNICPLFEETISLDKNIYKCLIEAKDMEKLRKSGLKLKEERVEEVLLTGSGLTFHRDFLKKVQNIIKNGEFCVKYLSLHPTFLKILVGQGEAERLVGELIKLKF